MAEEHVAQVLVVDPDATVGGAVHAYLGERGYAVSWVDEGEKAFNQLDSRFFDVLVTSLHLRHVDGIRLMSVARERNPDACVILIAEAHELEHATQAMRQGAYDFQTKPLNLDKLEAVIQRGLDHQRLALEHVALKRRLDERFGLRSLLGQSRQMTQVYRAVRQVGPSNETVLVCGEAGTGKDLIAQAIHNSSPRRDAPFVKLECAHTPENVLARELFGSTQEGPLQGRFELADGGTLYVEDIEALPHDLQDALAVALDHEQVTRQGDAKTIRVDVRFVAGAGGRPEALLEAGSLRPALHAALKTIVIKAPALRTRREDIPLVVNEMLRRFSEKHDKNVDGFTRNAMNVMTAYDWPDNMRELENVVEGMIATAHAGTPLGVQDIPAYLREQSVPESGEMRIPVGTSMHQIERIAIEETMKACDCDKKRCAATLGIGLRTLYRKLKEYDIR